MNLDELAQRALRGLKDFQRNTVDHVHTQLFAPNGSKRFLIADEVGLGKTIVARGVIGKAIGALKGKVERIDVVYICSNEDIAEENIKKLAVDSAAKATRLSLLVKHLGELRKSKAAINFVALTPSTSFEVQAGLGRKDERALLYRMLAHIWKLGTSKAPINALRGDAGVSSFDREVDAIDLESLDFELACTRALERAINADDAKSGEKTLREQFTELCAAYPRFDSRVSDEVRDRRARFVGQMRALLAATCLEMLEPDLIILDEFQRFAHLLEGQDDASQLARRMFEMNDAHVMLLSATPYRMYSTADDEGAEHYEDFVRTVQFLERGTNTAASFKELLGRYHNAMKRLGATKDSSVLELVARELEARLQKVMVRTERLAASTDRNGMLVQVDSGPLQVKAADATGYVAMDRMSAALELHDPVEYWKSAPYALNFMDDHYELTRAIERVDESARHEVARALRLKGHHRLETRALEARERIDMGNGRLRRLHDDTIGLGAQRLMWIPPSMPSYELGGPFADPKLEHFTKRLVFTSWRFVPRVIAGLLSYEAERTLDTRASRRRGGLLRFGRSEGRLTGMPVLAMLYPSSVLARACDPRSLLQDVASPGKLPTLAQVLEVAEERLQVSLDTKLKPGDGPVDPRWYWAAPLLLDRKLDEKATLSWIQQESLALTWSGEEDEPDSNFQAHVEFARAVIEGRETFGAFPPDLARVLAELALAGPGTFMLRSMLRISGMDTSALLGDVGLEVRNAAATAAWSFRTLFNQTEFIELVLGEAKERGDEEEGFWRVLLGYSLNGGMQAMLDEFVHVLRDSLGETEHDVSDRSHAIAEAVRESLSLRTTNLKVYDRRPTVGGRSIEHGDEVRLRCHFAVTLGDQSAEDGKLTRSRQVRRSFNSPFWPFVLATTSVGQEGLDFHPYCHAVVHWNLPSNPVDMEQREGRVHRFKNHAVRRNIAASFGLEVLQGDAHDLWEQAFEKAKSARDTQQTDIVPYWVYPREGGAKIQRHVLSLPLSREHERTDRLLRSLAVYRMVFGQPRQDDLLRYLTSKLGEEELAATLSRTRINLMPLH
ncbi:MAG: helicase-related protein [Archangium sp.]